MKKKFTKRDIEKLLKTVVILIDSREKKNRHITEVYDKNNVRWMKYKLDYGDYSIMLPANKELGIEEDIYLDKEVAVERKNSLQEIGANLSKKRAAFKREMERVGKGELIIMIEEDTYKDIVLKRYPNNIDTNSFLGSLHGISSEYKVPFIFVDRDVAAIFIYKYLYYYLRNKLKNNK